MRLWSNNSVPKGGSSLNPERRLLAAVLQRAITDYLTGDEEMRRSAQDWLFCEEPIDPADCFGFSYICEALDFHQEEVLKAVDRHDELGTFGKNDAERASNRAELREAVA